MIRPTDEMVIREHARGGAGHIEVHEILTPAEMLDQVTLFARIVVPVGSSIGYHRHTDDTEAYYILSGQGLFQDADGEKKPVGPGTICNIAVGESHGLENTGNEPMEIIALVFPKRA